MIPVADPDRSKEFYKRLGWRLDADFAFDNGFRVIQFTPPGSPASLQFGSKITSATPGSARGLYLVVSDIQAARDALAGRGVEISEVFHPGAPGAQFAQTAPAASAAPHPSHETYGSFATFSDPDGNEWLLQEITTRLPGRIDATETTFASAADLANAMRRASVAHGVHEQRMAASTTRTGPTGTPLTWWPSRLAPNRRNERRNRDPKPTDMNADHGNQATIPTALQSQDGPLPGITMAHGYAGTEYHRLEPIAHLGSSR